jgi:hypothetical protein
MIELTPVENYKVVGAVMTVGELIELLYDSPPEAGVFISGDDYSEVDGLAPPRDPITKVFTVYWEGTKDDPGKRIAYVRIVGTEPTAEEIAAHKARIERFALEELEYEEKE